jgi:hypothetical protein
MSGRVFIGQKHKRGVAGDRSVTIPGFLAVDVTSASNNRLGPQRIRASSLSPFRVGPVYDKDDASLECVVFENRWQYGKMWREAGHIGADGQPTPEWFAFRARGYANKTGKRRPLPKRRFGFPESSYYNGRIFNYLESRRMVYVPEYAALVRDCAALRALRALLAEGTHILILDNDNHCIQKVEK